MRASGAVLALLLRVQAALGLGCLNSRGSTVDWFFVSKAPGCTDATLPACSLLSYNDASTPASPRGLYFSGAESALSNSALDATLAQASGARNATARVLWNDDPPCPFNPSASCGSPSTSAGLTNAHSKGVLVSDAGGGFWLTHSWPEWPDLRGFAPAAGGVANASTIYGQSFLCVSLSAAGVEAVATALLRAEPLTYDGFVPVALEQQFPRLVELVGNVRVVTANPTVLALNSSGGAGFTFFSKNGVWGKELWADLIAPSLALGGEMLVETWRRSPQLPSSCNSSDYGNVLNVRQVALNISGSVVLKLYTTDHSKYGISAVPSWVCIGDINRMGSQSSRGGGAVCFQHAANLWATLNATFVGVDVCASTPLRATQTASVSTSMSPTQTPPSAASPQTPTQSMPRMQTASITPTQTTTTLATSTLVVSTAPGGLGTADVATAFYSGSTLAAIVTPCLISVLICVAVVVYIRGRARRKMGTPLTSTLSEATQCVSNAVVSRERCAVAADTQNNTHGAVGVWRRVQDDESTWFENDKTFETSWTLPTDAFVDGGELAAQPTVTRTLWRLVRTKSVQFFENVETLETAWNLPEGAVVQDRREGDL